jgi:protease-4
LNEIATGRIFSAVEALSVGLIDELGFVEDAIDRAIELAKLEKDDVRVVKYKRNITIMQAFMGARAQSSSNMGFDMIRALEASAPRAYYISTWLPPVVSSHMLP